MSKPISEPLVPAQPQADLYAVTELALFRSFTRDTYRSTFGVEPPPFDGTRLCKYWFDSTADTSHESNVSLYRVLGYDAKGMPALRQMVLPSSEAATVNLPGIFQYPPYLVAPGKATRTGSLLNPIYLSLEADARSLMRELGGQNLKDEGSDDVFRTFYPTDEPRRVWVFQLRGYSLNAGMALYDRNALGIGRPGQWDLSGSVPSWLPEAAGPTGLDDRRLPRGVPLREMLTNERLQVGLTQDVSVMRTDLHRGAQEDMNRFTIDDRACLQRILQLVTKVAG